MIISTLTALLVVVKAQQVVPIPSRPQGFPYGQSTCQAPVHIEVHTDLICPNCKQEFPTVLEVADYYGPQNVSLKLLMFPLPYHRAAYLAAQVNQSMS